jgi:hypothetical protein
MRSSLPTLQDPAVQEAIAPPKRRRAGRTAEQLDPDSVLDLQQTAGNHAVNTLVQERDGDFKTKIEAIKGGLTGLELDISFNVSGKKAAGIQAVQAWWDGEKGADEPSATFKQILKNDYPGYKYI